MTLPDWVPTVEEMAEAMHNAPHDGDWRATHRQARAIRALLERRAAEGATAETGCLACAEPRRDRYGAIAATCAGCGWRITAKPSRKARPRKDEVT